MNEVEVLRLWCQSGGEDETNALHAAWFDVMRQFQADGPRLAACVLVAPQVLLFVVAAVPQERKGVTPDGICIHPGITSRSAPQH